VLGTPGYMSPEQIRRTPLDERADVYSLGCTLFEILTAEPLHPRGMEALKSTLLTIEGRPAERRPNADIPPELDEACRRATAQKAEGRFAGAREVHDAVMRYLDGDRDLLLRRELSAQHSASAEQAFQAGADEKHRAEAMREAGRALSLDPTNVRAADLLARIMLEPPPSVPEAVKEAMSDAAARAGAEQSRAATWVYVTILLLLPVLTLLGVKSWALFGAIAAATAMMIGITVFLGRRRHVSQATLLFGVAMDAALTVLIGLLSSPVLSVPVLAMSSALAFSGHPRIRTPWVPVAVASVVILLPVAGELVGIFPRTFEILSDSIVVRPWSLGVHPFGTVAVFVIFWLSALVSASVTILKLRRSQETAANQLQLQAWHLRQLLPLVRTPPG
jgi:eukaryotic-like serine/threonine-protein kinase